MKFQLMGVLAISALLAACCCDGPAPQPGALVVTQPDQQQLETLQEKFVKTVGDRAFFGFDKYNLTAEAKAILDRQADFLLKNPDIKVVPVVGHCDSRGTTEYNFGLGERRANAVRKYLISRGVAAERIQPCSMGKEKPIVQGDTPAAYAQNRVVITLVGAEQSEKPMPVMPAMPAMPAVEPLPMPAAELAAPAA